MRQALLSPGDGGSVLAYPVRIPSLELLSLSHFGLSLSAEDPKWCSVELQIPDPSWCFLQRLGKEGGLKRQRRVRVNKGPRTVPTNTTRKVDGRALTPYAWWVSLLS
ncbi:hypothetical protein V6N13_062362 [Hibiscus sabdariffa]